MTIEDRSKVGHRKINDLQSLLRGLPGDKIEVRIVKVKKTYGYGKLIRIIEASPMRVTPCPHAKDAEDARYSILTIKPNWI